jgi:hypothetical protein
MSLTLLDQEGADADNLITTALRRVSRRGPILRRCCPVSSEAAVSDSTSRSARCCAIALVSVACRWRRGSALTKADGSQPVRLGGWLRASFRQDRAGGSWWRFAANSASATCPSRRHRAPVRHHAGAAAAPRAGATSCGETLCGLSSRSAPPHSATVTRRKVAGMEVASSLWLAFWSLKRASSSACRSASRPLAAAASNAFMVGP